MLDIFCTLLRNWLEQLNPNRTILLAFYLDLVCSNPFFRSGIPEDSRVPFPGVGCQFVTSSFLVGPHDVQPCESSIAGPTNELLHDSTLVPLMTIQAVLD